ncbi:tetrahydrofolate synthase OS=Streptomyces microflavus OX=1919 GN=Smic_24170 PE=4 SV=1 [Streptomyces microflavus]
MDVLGEPQRAYPSIHITGTNGKTSTARMIEALLNAFELRTGRYTSPHVQSITERISLDGSPIEPERFIETYEDIKPYVEMVDAQQPYRLSFFEVLTGMAYAAFADAPVDVAIRPDNGEGPSRCVRAYGTTMEASTPAAPTSPTRTSHLRYLGRPDASSWGTRGTQCRSSAVTWLSTSGLPTRWCTSGGAASS